MRYTTTIHGEETEIRLDQELVFGSEQKAWIGNKEIQFELIPDQTGYLLKAGLKQFRILDVEWNGNEVRFAINGFTHIVEVKNERDHLLEKLGFSTVQSDTQGVLKAPMPGKVISILASLGDQVEQDQPLVVLEAMKMENELKSPVSGMIEAIVVQPGDSVEKNQPLLEIISRG